MLNRNTVERACETGRVAATRRAVRRCVSLHTTLCSERGESIDSEIRFRHRSLSSPMCSVERPRVSSYRLNAVIGMLSDVDPSRAEREGSAW